MMFLLSSQNVFHYLIKHNLLNPSTKQISKIEQITAKNFNLLVRFEDNTSLLVKQEIRDRDGKAEGDFLKEWQIQEMIRQFPKLRHLSKFLPELLWFDRQNFLLIFRYLDNYLDLYDFYIKGNQFPLKIATQIGKTLATLHRDSYSCQDYQEFFVTNDGNQKNHQVHRLIRSWERIEPEIFGEVPAEALKFFALYQKYDSLGNAIAQLGNSFKFSCLTHNDLKLNNILLNRDWELKDENILRLIDWERFCWGDPAFDLGTIISSYLQIWLSSLVISQSLTIEESLGSAMIPLKSLQPSIASLQKAYLQVFPMILKHRPDFLERTVQFAGFTLIQQIQAKIQFQKCFDNTGIVMLQVGKSLLCRPKHSIPTIFGTTADKLV